MHRTGTLQTGLALALLATPQLTLAQEDSSESRPATRTSAVEVTPYIEAAQVLSAQLSPGNDVVTYTRLAAGVDATMAGRNNAAALSLRYERLIGWGDNDAPDGDVISGIARASFGIVPRTLTFETGALATRTRVNGSGATAPGFVAQGDQTSQIYSAYAGPSLNTRLGDVGVSAHYRLGYTRVEAPDAVIRPAGDPVDIFDDSVTHAAQISAGIAPDTVLPVGLSATAGWTEENISNLDQRVRDRFARLDVTVPVTPTIALVGGVGYEDVEVSLRDALRDASGDPVIGNDGRYVTDSASPRIIAYEADGLIWDAGVVWRPSRRTQLSANVGRRYDSTIYYGSFSWQASSRTSFNASVYDGISGFGGRMGTALSGLSTSFTAVRNPLNGNLSGCVQSLDGGNCLGGALGSVRSAVFRSRGVAASYGVDLGQTQLGFGAGYDRRRFIAAPGTVLAGANGVVDETIWMAANAGHRLDARSGVTGNVYANLFQTGFDDTGDLLGYGASVSYYRELIARLTATAAVGLDGLEQKQAPDLLSASALVGLRYSF